MVITFGKKHNGKSVELVMLRDPSYIKWMLSLSNPSGSIKKAIGHVKTLQMKFDAKPYLGKTCWNKLCKNPVTKLTVYHDNLDPYWWCDTCDPYDAGANPGKLQSPDDYDLALLHVDHFCSNRKSDYLDLIKTIAEAKGLPKRVGENAAQQFFA